MMEVFSFQFSQTLIAQYKRGIYFLFSSANDIQYVRRNAASMGRRKGNEQVEELLNFETGSYIYRGDRLLVLTIS